ncbi:hypothetical protein B566_EDAN010753 [Ephemera danica]|nr:hypothetical protein B566_EDAN010753 [Ephemera danica]
MYSKVLYGVGAVSSSAIAAWGLKSYLSKQEPNVVPLSFVADCSVPVLPVEEVKIPSRGIDDAIKKSTDLLLRIKDQIGAPGIVIGVSIDGKSVWKKGLGFADVENRSPCHENTVMRIASISKSMTMAIVARLWEEGKLDLDKPVQDYKGEEPEVELSDPDKNSRKKKDEKDKKSTRQIEVYNKDKFETVEKALKLFQDDELLSNPGSKYNYTTHGWTLVSAVVEGAGKEPFTKQAKKLFTKLGLHNTRLDESEPIIFNRSNYYRINSKGRLVNVPYTDNSYKWAGGGFVSTVGDLLKFGNCMLYSYQWQPGLTVQDGEIVTKYVTDEPMHPTPDLPPGFLKSETIKSMWTPEPVTQGVNEASKYRDAGYGKGWQVTPFRAEFGTTGGGDIQSFQAYHSGAAVGASSVLFILPSKDLKKPPPKGVCVAILTNMQNVGLVGVADDIAHIFAEL